MGMNAIGADVDENENEREDDAGSLSVSRKAATGRDRPVKAPKSTTVAKSSRHHLPTIPSHSLRSSVKYTHTAVSSDKEEDVY